MSTKVAARLEPQGLLIPRSALRDWETQELEVVWEPEVVIVRPKVNAVASRDQVRTILREAGMLYKPNWETPPPVSAEERAYLAKKLSQGRPLSEIVIEERDDRA